MSDVEFDDGVIRVHNVAGDFVGLRQAVPLSARRKAGGSTWVEAAVCDAPHVVQWADTKRGAVSVDPAVRDLAAGLWRVESRHLAEATASAPRRDVPPVRGLTSTFLDTQAALVAAAPHTWVDLPEQRASRHRAMIIGDDQGLGKTLTALAILRIDHLASDRTVIVCPTSLTQNWANEMGDHFTPGTFTPWTATGETPVAIPDDTDTVVIGWEIVTWWADTLMAWGPTAVVVDEGHYGKSGRKKVYRRERRNANGEMVQEKAVSAEGSDRGTAIHAIGKAVAASGGMIMPLTGTPMVNRPLELVALLEMCGVEKLFLSAGAFKDRFCDPKTVPGSNGRRRTYVGASNLGELNTRLLTSGVYFRRTKKVLVDQGLLKPKYVDRAYVYDYGATPRPWVVRPTTEQWQRYEAARQETQTFFRDRAEEIAAEHRAAVSAPVVRRKVAAEGAKHLKQLSALRKAVAELKIPHVSEQVSRLVERGEKVVVVAHHREVVAAYAERFGGLRIQGGMGTAAIEEAKAKFNETPVGEYPVMVLAVEAGKTGHTLCKQATNGVGPSCAYMLFAEQIWTPGDEAQAQDRIWRIGQEREVHIANAVMAGTVDETIYQKRQTKRMVFNAAIDAVNQRALRQERTSDTGALVSELVYGSHE